MDLTYHISVVESGYRNILEEFFLRVPGNKILPSHDLYHHRRVWTYAKELLFSLCSFNIQIPESTIEKLIIACYLHDSGMAIDTGAEHGVHSLEFCRLFLRKNNISIDEVQELEDVIRKHDAKEYLVKTAPWDLFALLSAADDLDAFGITGIYRYSEIYLKRGIDIETLGEKVLKNVRLRYTHFSDTYGYDNKLVERQIRRYEEVVDFFSEFNQQVKDYQFSSDKKTGTCGIIEVILDSMKKPLFTIDDIVSSGMRESERRISDFYKRLRTSI